MSIFWDPKKQQSWNGRLRATGYGLHMEGRTDGGMDRETCQLKYHFISTMSLLYVFHNSENISNITLIRTEN